MTRKALGRGLSALLPNTANASDDYLELDIDRITPNEHQPRSTFHEDKLEELAQSIRENGMVQPILVRRNGTGYQIIAGERRWRAAQRVGLHKIPAVIRDVEDEKVLELALIENIQREELNPIEEANAYQRLMEDLKLRQEDVAKRVGKDRTTITNMLRLLRLSPDVQRLLEDNRLSVGHARAILALPTDEDQRKVAEVVIAKGFSVRETERYIKHIIEGGAPQPKPAAKAAPDPNLKAAETKLEQTLKTKVRINHQPNNAGTIEIAFHSTDELDRLYWFLLGKSEAARG
ncbi:MAG: ParB/RepB/Spo0J family partition protein [Blastocatellia bacterium]|nr:ParB/RepB/Spo0J family partition protein [Blastocatellia bacterium]